VVLLAEQQGKSTMTSTTIVQDNQKLLRSMIPIYGSTGGRVCDAGPDHPTAVDLCSLPNERLLTSHAGSPGKTVVPSFILSSAGRVVVGASFNYMYLYPKACVRSSIRHHEVDCMVTLCATVGVMTTAYGAG